MRLSRGWRGRSEVAPREKARGGGYWAPRLRNSMVDNWASQDLRAKSNWAEESNLMWSSTCRN